MNTKIFSIFLAVAVFLVSVTACATGASARVSNIYLTNAIDDTNKITTFAPTDTIFVFFDVNKIESNSEFQINWYALNVEGLDPTTPIRVTNHAYDDETTIIAFIENKDGGFLAGQYKVEINLDGSKVGEQQFTIQ